MVSGPKHKKVDGGNEEKNTVVRKNKDWKKEDCMNLKIIFLIVGITPDNQGF